MIDHWPQYVWLGCAVVTLGISLTLDGQPQKRPHSFWSKIIAIAIDVGLLWAGGFFSGL